MHHTYSTYIPHKTHTTHISHLRARVNEPLLVHPLVADVLGHVVTDRISQYHHTALARSETVPFGLGNGRVDRRAGGATA